MIAEFYKLKRPILLWLMLILFFATQFVMRLFVGVIREDIIVKFAVDTIAFGTFASAYYWGYSLMQIPVGFLLDKFNFRYISFIMICFASLGTYLLTLSDSWEIIILSRFIVGFGSAVSFLAIAKVIKSFFPEKLHSMMIGFSFTLGLLGALVAGRPSKFLYDMVGFENTFKIISLVGLITAILILIISDKNIEKSESDSSNKVTFKKTIKLIMNPKILLIGLFGGFMVGPLEGFSDFWGKSYFMHVEGFLEENSIDIVFTVYMGLCVGGPLLTYLSNKFKSDIIMILATGILTVMIFFILFTVIPLSKSQSMILMFILGILCCYQVLVFTLVTSIVSKEWASLSIAIVNCLNMLFGTFFHKMIPFLVVYFSPGELKNIANPIYTVDVYIRALSIIPILSMIGTIGFIFLSLQQKKGKLKKIEL